MAYAPPFLAALELTRDTDERAIRRAYAKRLKQIDQETQPREFQALRDHYERALEWVAGETRRRQAEAERERDEEEESDSGDAAWPGVETLTIQRPVMPPPLPEPPPLPAPPENVAHVAAIIGLPLARREGEAPPASDWPTLPPIGAPLSGERDAAPPAPWHPPKPPPPPALGLGSRTVPVPAPVLALRRERTPAPPPDPRPMPLARPLRAPPPPDDAPAPAPVVALRDAAPPSPRRIDTDTAPPLPRPLRAPPPPDTDTPPSPVVAPARQAAPAPIAPPATPIGAPLVPHPAPRTLDDAAPDVLADAVFSAFAALVARGIKNIAIAKRTLGIALDDARLVNLDARGFFEARVVGLIVGGWKPGHELLFDAATEQFGWEADRRRLQAFGQAGAAIDAAVRERIVFWSQPGERVEIEHRLIRRLRTGKARGTDELVGETPAIEVLLQRYPNWLRIVTSREIVEDWLSRWQALPQHVREPMTLASAAQPPAAQPAPARNRDPYRLSTPPKPKPSKSYTGVYIAIGVLVAIVNAMSGSDKSTPMPQSQSQPAWSQPATRLAASPQGSGDLAARQQQAEAALQRALQQAAAHTDDTAPRLALRRPGSTARSPN